MTKKFALFVASRYFWPKRKEKNRAHSLLTLIGLSLGVATLITTLGVMNGLQQGYINTILQVGSGHIRLTSRGFLPNQKLEKIKKITAIQSIVAETESQTMLRKTDTYNNVTLKGYNFNLIHLDPSFKQNLNLIKGHYPKEGEILIGDVMANNASLTLGSRVNTLAINESQLTAYEKPLTVSGIFKTGYYDYDANLTFVSLKQALQGFALEKEIYYKVLLTNRYNDLKTVKTLTHNGFEVESWRSFNSAFFGALRLEKNIMMILLSLIFVVVAVSVFQGRARDIEERLNEIAIMRAMGTTTKTILNIFLLQGFFIGIIGAFFGFIFGLIISFNITEILSFFELLINNTYLLLHSTKHISLLSGDSFYLDNGIPIILYAHEIFFIITLALVSSLFATYRAIKRITTLKPLEALHHN